MTIPTKPAGYWRPDVSLTDVYYLRGDMTWHLSPAGVEIADSNVPHDLVLLGEYQQPYKDPEPYIYPSGARSKHNNNPAVQSFDPRPGYEQDMGFYQ